MLSLALCARLGALVRRRIGLAGIAQSQALFSCSAPLEFWGARSGKGLEVDRESERVLVSTFLACASDRFS